MPDREKVIKGLECCSNCDESGCLCKECPYGTNEYDTCDTIDHLLKDALKVLKEQEAVTPIKARQGRNEYYSYFLCPVCKNDIMFHQPYCEECGRKMKWDED